MSAVATENKEFPIGWETLHRDTRALAWRLAEKGPWKGLIAVTRGGLVPAGIVSRELEIYHIETFCINTYDFKDQRDDAKIIKDLGADVGKGEGWLVVDDLVDTGNTFKIIRDILPDAHYASVYAKPQGREFTDTFVTEVSQDTWIIFPWEAGLET